MSDILAPLLNFSVVAFVLWYFGRSAIASLLETRSREVSGAIQDAEAKAKQAALLLAESETNWNASQVHAKKQMEEAKGAMARQRDVALVAARAEAERIQREAKLVGESEVTKTRTLLQRDVVRRSVSLAREYLGKQLSEKDQGKLVSEYLEIVGNGAA